MAMKFPRRRLVGCWLLLFAAAMGVGAGSWFLLQREEARLTLRKNLAEEARRAAVEARARLVAENVELLVGDVQAGLLDTLGEVPAAGLDGALDAWETGNPLVRTVYLCTMEGRLLRPTGSEKNEEARGFRRRFGVRLAESPPWRAANELVAAEKGASSSFKDGAALEPARQEMESRLLSTNVAKIQSARKETQTLARAKSSAQPKALMKTKVMDSEDLEAGKKMKMEASGPAQDKESAKEQKGWIPLRAEGRLHLLGWVHLQEEKFVRGVEVEMDALVARLGDALPAELALDEGYALRDDRGRVVHQAGRVTSAEAPVSTRISLAPSLLPGWEVVAHLRPALAEKGGGFYVMGLLLAGILMAAILLGGSMLLMQASSSAADAAQKTSFVANVSHEFKTPLTTIRLYSELLEQGRVASPEKQADYLRTIGRETQRLSRLVNNVLDFSRLEQGRKKYQLEPMDLTLVLAELAEAHAPRIADSGMVLKRELPVEKVSVVTDRDAVCQVVLNLIDNACKYAAEGREVLLGLRTRPEGGVAITVSDRGPGVAGQNRERIFDKFHRVDETLTAEKGGAGLGLSIARQLARGLGGDLRYEPREERGAVFVFELP